MTNSQMEGLLPLTYENLTRWEDLTSGKPAPFLEWTPGQPNGLHYQVDLILCQLLCFCFDNNRPAKHSPHLLICCQALKRFNSDPKVWKNDFFPAMICCPSPLSQFWVKIFNFLRLCISVIRLFMTLSVISGLSCTQFAKDTKTTTTTIFQKWYLVTS